MKKKLLVLMAVCVMAAMSVTACGSSAADSKAEETTEAGDFWEETKESEEETTATETVAETETETETETTTETAAETETATETGAEGEWLVSEKYDVYLSWTGAEWDSASDEEKVEASIAYTAYVSELMDVSSAEEMVTALEQPSSAGELQTVVTTIDSMFAYEETRDMTLLELIELGVSQMQ